MACLLGCVCAVCHQSLVQQQAGLDPASAEALGFRIQALTSKLYTLTGVSKVIPTTRPH